MNKMYRIIDADEKDSIGTTITTITATNPFRRVYLVNTGATTLSLMVDADPDTGSQIMLVPNAIFNETISGKTLQVKSDGAGGKLGYVFLG